MGNMMLNKRGRAMHPVGYRGQQVLAFAQAVISEQGVGPSYSMICRELGIATRGEVSRIVSRLESRGLLRRVGAEKVRRIRLPHMLKDG